MISDWHLCCIIICDDMKAKASKKLGSRLNVALTAIAPAALRWIANRLNHNGERFKVMICIIAKCEDCYEKICFSSASFSRAHLAGL